MTSKRGILLGNAVNIIIAVLGLAVFGFFVIQIYQLYANQEDKNARNMLDVLEGKINTLMEGQHAEILLQGFEGADNWALESWGANEVKPNMCKLGESCLCACTGDVSKCENGFCKTFKVDDMETSTRFSPPNLIQQSDGTFREVNSIEHVKAKQTLFSVNVSKEKDSITIEAIVKGETTFTPASGADKL